MKICVLVKQVPDHEAIVKVGAGGAIEVEDRWVTNFFDEIAVEQALRLREAHGGTVTAIAAGGGKQVDALRRALAMGADAAVQIDDPALAEADGLGKARALAACASSLGADVVLAGRAALDDEQGLVGPAVAERLGWPHVAGIVRLEVAAGGAFRAVRLVEGGRDTVEGSLPALFTATKGLADPRVPKVMQVMKASKARMDKRDLASLGVDAAAVAPAARVVGYRAPPGRPPVVMMEGEVADKVRAIAEILRAHAGARS